MKKRFSIVVFVISIILLASINSSTQYAIAQEEPPVDEQQRILDQTYLDARLYGIKFQVKEPNQPFFNSVKRSTTDIPEIRNGSEARFITTFANVGNEIVYLKYFRIAMYNASNKGQPAKIFLRTFSDPASSVVDSAQIGMNTSETVAFDTILPFDNYDEVYTISFTMIYTSSLNTTLEITLPANLNNFTVRSIAPDPTPPEFIVWTWMFLTLFIVIQVSIGYYGNRQLRKKARKN